MYQICIFLLEKRNILYTYSISVFVLPKVPLALYLGRLSNIVFPNFWSVWS